MGLIPALLLLSNCKASLRENIDLLLIKSNYIFSPSTLYIQRFYNVIFSPPPLCVHCISHSISWSNIVRLLPFGAAL